MGGTAAVETELAATSATRPAVKLERKEKYMVKFELRVLSRKWDWVTVMG